MDNTTSMLSRVRLWTVFLAAVFFTSLAAQAAFPSARASHVKATLVALDEGIHPGHPVTVALKLEHAPNWHTYGKNPDTGYPTSLAWSLPAGWKAGEIQWPAPTPIKDGQGNITDSGYEGIVHLPVTLTAPADLEPGAQVTLRAKAAWLACNDVCMPGSADVSLTLPVLADVAQTAKSAEGRAVSPKPPSDGALGERASPIQNSTERQRQLDKSKIQNFRILLLTFLGGLILNLMPCVFPVLGIKILGFVNQAGASRRKVTLHGIAFTTGVLVSFWILAALLAILRAGGGQLGWGFQLQSAPFVFVLAAVLLVFALSLSGVFEIGYRAASAGAGLQEKSGITGSFFTGVFATVVATPCAAPFLAPALGAALSLPTGASFLVFTFIALGLSTPYLLLSIFPGAVKRLPRPGAWMETFKQFMAFLLYATVAFLVWTLVAQTSETGLLMALLGLVLIAMAAWLYGRYAAPGNSPARRRFGIIGALVLVVLGAWLGWPRAAAPTDITWEKWSPAAVASAQAAGKTVYVDFTARWCLTCQANKKAVFASAEVRRVFRDKNIVALKADWTNADPQITAELARFGRAAVPFNLVYKPGQPEPIILPELLTPGIVLDVLK